MPTETRDPATKQRYRGLPLVLHVLGEVARTVLEPLLALLLADVVASGVAGDAGGSALLPADLRDSLAEYLIGFLAVTVLGICLLIAVLLRSGLLVEVER